MNRINIIIIALLVSAIVNAQDAILANKNSNGTSMQIAIESGKAHNHPTFSIWLEELDGKYIQTLFVTRSVATGVYQYKPTGKLKWVKGPGEARRPAILPYWLHKRNIKAEDGTYLPSPKKPVADAYTGATPTDGFTLHVKSDEKLTGKKVLLLEVNQPWDFNEFWHNDKYSGDINYLTSCQPALIYAVTIDFDNPMEEYYLNPIGHSHPSGKDGDLYTNLTTFTTALEIFESIKVLIN